MSISNYVAHPLYAGPAHDHIHARLGKFLNALHPSPRIEINIRELIFDRHQTHIAVVKRLKRAEGHMRKIVSMFEKDRACVAVAQQLQAVESIVRSAKQVFIRDYIDHCLDEQLETAPDVLSVLEDLKQISKYL